MASDYNEVPFTAQTVYDARQVEAYLRWLHTYIEQVQDEIRLLRGWPKGQRPFAPAEGEVGVHIVFACPPAVLAEEFGQMIEGAHDLLTTALYIAMLGYDFHRRLPPEVARRLSNSESLQDERAWEVAARTSNAARIQQLAYGSPLEVLYLISGGTLVASLAINRMLSSFRNYQYTRVAKSEADTKVLAQRAIQQAIEQNGGRYEFIGKLASTEIESAASVLERVQTIDIVEPAGKVTTVEVNPLANEDLG